MSDTKQTPQNCRWAQPAVYLPIAYWADVWNGRWTCARDETRRSVETAAECAACPRWEQRAAAHVSWTYAQVGL